MQFDIKGHSGEFSVEITPFADAPKLSGTFKLVSGNWQDKSGKPFGGRSQYAQLTWKSSIDKVISLAIVHMMQEGDNVSQS